MCAFVSVLFGLDVVVLFFCSFCCFFLFGFLGGFKGQVRWPEGHLTWP